MCYFCVTKNLCEKVKSTLKLKEKQQSGLRKEEGKKAIVDLVFSAFPQLPAGTARGFAYLKTKDSSKEKEVHRMNFLHYSTLYSNPKELQCSTISGVKNINLSQINHEEGKIT